MSQFQYIVTKEDREAERSVKELVRANFTFSSRLMTKLKQKHLVKLNGETMQWWITPEAGDIITVELPEEKSDFPPEDIPIAVVYEDADLLVINKQPGVVVHPTKGKPCHTIANGLLVPAAAAPTATGAIYFKLKGTGNFTEGAGQSFVYYDVWACKVSTVTA